MKEVLRRRPEEVTPVAFTCINKDHYQSRGSQEALLTAGRVVGDLVVALGGDIGEAVESVPKVLPFRQI